MYSHKEMIVELSKIDADYLIGFPAIKKQLFLLN